MQRDGKAARNVPKIFEDAGFQVVTPGNAPASIEVKKNSCTWVVERRADGTWAPSGPPRFTVRGLNCELEDRGYQKFWYADGRRFPIRKTDLQTLHRFEEEVRGVLGLTSLYNQSLGTISARTVYDRLTGRPDK
jgi:hypothetical protein